MPFQQLADQIAEKQAKAIDNWLVPMFEKYIPGYKGLRIKNIIGDEVLTTNLARFLRNHGFHLEMERDINSMGCTYRFKKGQEVLGILKLETVLTRK